MANSITLQRGAMYDACGGLRAEHVSRSNLYASCADCYSSCDTFGIGDAASSDHRNIHRPHDLRQQGKRANLGTKVFRQEDAAMSARLEALSPRPSLGPTSRRMAIQNENSLLRA